MILTCPDCATSYYVPDNAVGGAGRKVRCATCGFAWHAEPTEPDEPFLAPPPRARRAAAQPAVEAEEEELAEELYEEPPDELGSAEEPALAEAPEPEEEPPVFATAPPRAALRLGPRAVQAIAWGGAAAAVALVVALALMFRSDVVRVWPPAAGAYARIGLPVNAVGLALQEVSARRQFQGGRQALVVSGVVKNVRAEPVAPPPLSVTFLDRKGKVLAVKTAPAAAGPLASGAARSFSVSMADPPAAASELEVSFDTGGRPARSLQAP